MKSHAIKPEKLYTTMPQEPEPIYPHISLPAEIFEDENCELGEEYIVEVKIKLKSMDENFYSGELIESEIESEEQEAKENEK